MVLNKASDNVHLKFQRRMEWKLKLGYWMIRANDYKWNSKNSAAKWIFIKFSASNCVLNYNVSFSALFQRKF